MGVEGDDLDGPLVNGGGPGSPSAPLSKQQLLKQRRRHPDYQRPMPASKKKRKSSDEKFLEDNSDYYGIKVLNTKLRSAEEHDEEQIIEVSQYLNARADASEWTHFFSFF